MTGSARYLERDHCVELFRLFFLGFAEKVMVLEAHPVFRFVSEIASELQAVLRGEQAAAEFVRGMAVIFGSICSMLAGDLNLVSVLT